MPPLARDPWAALALLALVPLVLHSLGAPLGEPFADDFDYLHRVLLGGPLSFFDGGGSALYWRPLGRQVYYGLLTPLILNAPGVVAALHVALLAVTIVLLYRTLRPRWSGPAAAASSSFVALAESTRMLAAWPSHFMDLGAILFAVLALHQASRRRWLMSLAALLASLLCKEVGVLAALLLPWMPGDTPRRERVRWTVAAAALVGAWALAYRVVLARTGLLMTSSAVASNATPLPARLAWALWNSARAAFSLPAAGAPGAPPWGVALALAVGALLACAALAWAFAPSARTRIARALPWVAWGSAWFLGASLALTQVFPAWAPYRSAFGAIGLGIALVALLDAASPWLVGALVALRLVSFALSPGPPPRITDLPVATGADFDFGRLVRLERIVAGTRDLLRARLPRIAPHSAVLAHHLPHMASYGFSGDKALQVWYRDTTLRWTSADDYRAMPDHPLAAVVEYIPERERQIVLVEPAAMIAMLHANDVLRTGDWEAALVALDRAEALQPDSAATVFRSILAGKRATAYAFLGRFDATEREAERALGLWRDDPDARLMLGAVWAKQGRFRDAEAMLDTLLGHDPGLRSAATLRDSIRTAQGLPPRGTPGLPGGTP